MNKEIEISRENKCKKGRERDKDGKMVVSQNWYFRWNYVKNLKGQRERITEREIWKDVEKKGDKSKKQWRERNKERKRANKDDMRVREIYRLTKLGLQNS